MNNSLHRLIDGMVATLRSEVIPQIGTEFARGQAFGVIYMLNSIRLRADWSGAFYREQIAAQVELREALMPLLESFDAPSLPDAAPAGADTQALETLRDDNEGRVCDLIAWTSDNSVPTAIDTALRHYIDRQLKVELGTSAKPMFAEMSSGSE